MQRKNWANLKFYALLELGAALLVTLNIIFLCQRLCAGAFALCTSGLVKLTLGGGVDAREKGEV